MSFRNPGFRSNLSNLHRLTVTSIVVLLALVSVSPAASALGQTTGDSYTNPIYGYQLSWDSAVWTVAEDGSGDLTLESDIVMINLQSGQFYNGDATACRDDLVERLPDDDMVRSVAPFTGDGDPEQATEVRAFETLEVELQPDSGETRTVAERIDCRTIVSGEAVLAITWTAPVDEYESALGQTNDLLDQLEVPSFVAPDGSVEGVAGSTFTSTDPAFTLSWDDSEWTPFVPVDAILGLNSSTSLITFDLPDDFGGDPADCVEGSLDALSESPGLVDTTPIERNGEDLAGLDDTGWSYLALDADYGRNHQFIDIRCASVGASDIVLRAVQSGPLGAFDAETDVAAPVFASLLVEDVQPSERTRPATPEAATTPSAATPAGDASTPVTDERDATPAATDSPNATAIPVMPGATPVSPKVPTGRVSGGNGGRYRSSANDWSLTYDDQVWTVLDPALYATVDLALRNGSTVLTLDTVASNGADPEDVLDGLLAAVESGAGNVELLDVSPRAPVDGSVSAATQVTSSSGSTVVIGFAIVPVTGDMNVVVRIYDDPNRFTGQVDTIDALLSGLET